MTRRATADEIADHDRDLRKHDIQIMLCRFGHCARVATCYNQHVIGGYRCDEHLPPDIKLPAGWDWARVETLRAKYDIAENMIPLTSGDMGVVAWGTIDSVRAERNATVAEPLRSIVNSFSAGVGR
jgi:hypothetical protein